MGIIEFTYLFLVFLLLWFVVSIYLNTRQIKAAQSNNDVAIEFEHAISKEDNAKASSYTTAKLKLNNAEITITATLLLFWTIFGGLELLNNIIGKFININNTIFFGAVIIIVFNIINSLINLPFSVYQTFVLEQKFGFNRTTIKVFIADLGKTLLLSLIIGMPLVMLILYLMEKSANLWWFYTWIVLSIFSLIMIWIYPNFIAPIFNKFSPLDNDELHDKIDKLLNKTGFKSNGLFVMDGSKRSTHGNAYFTGLGQNKRIVFFDTLLKTMSDNEILAVLAHELGHFHHKHIVKNIMVSFTITFIALLILGLLINEEWFYIALGVATIEDHNALILFMLILPIFSFFITPIMNLLSRKNEFEADNFAVNNTSGNDLVTALTKLYRDNAAIIKPDNIYSIFYDSHPNALARLANIKTQRKNA